MFAYHNSFWRKLFQTTQPPNIVVVLVDDLGYADVGFNGCKDIPTPNIDRIASEGVKFTDGYVSAPICGPSRAGLLTGRYQDRFGFGRNPLFAPNDPKMGLPVTEQTLAEALQQVGYHSVAIGKWHMGAYETLRPLRRGFDDFFGFLTGGHRYFPDEYVFNSVYELKNQGDAYRTKLLRNNKRVEETAYLTDALSREAVHYINKYKDKPFFIYLAYNAPHGPLQATKKYLDRFKQIKNKKRRTYAAMVSAVDDGVGMVLKTLEENGVADNTLVVFLSDNGGPTHKNASCNDPLRGRKGQLYEGGIRVPFAMKWPGKIASGMVYRQPVISLDIFATVVSNTSKKVKLKNKLDGVNLLPYLRSECKKAPHDYLFWRSYGKKIFAARNAQNQKIFGNSEAIKHYNLKQNLEENDQKIVANKKVMKKLKKGLRQMV